MSRVAPSGRGPSTGEPKEDQAEQLHGIVVQSNGSKVGIYNAVIHQQKKLDIIEWDAQDSYDNRLIPGDWVVMVWRREMVVKVTRFKGEPPMPVRLCKRTAGVLIQIALSLKEPDAGKHGRQLWSDELQSIGLPRRHAIMNDMTIGGGTKKMWIAWMKDMTERNKYLQRTGYDIVWMLAHDQGEELYANGRADNGNGGDSGVASLVTPIQSDDSGETKTASRTERVRLRGSYPGTALNRVGIITGHKEGSPFYYVWTPGAPPTHEGKIILHKIDGKEQMSVCDWIRFRVSESDEEAVFKNRCTKDRFEVVTWQQVDRYFPTQLSPNKLTIEIAISKMVMTSKNTKEEGGEIFFEDDDFGWIGDRNSLFVGSYPIEEGRVIEFEGVIRRVKPRHDKDSAWMVLQRKVNYSGMDERNKKEGRESNGRDRRDDYRSNGREERRRDYDWDERDGRRDDYRRSERGDGGRRDHILLTPPKYKGSVEGDVIESIGFVEGLGQSEAYVWLIDAAASGVVNGGAKYLKIGDVLYAKFRLQKNGKWGSMGVARPADLPRELNIKIRRGKVYVQTRIIYDKVREMYHSPWFDTVFDTDFNMPPDPMDKEVYEVELNKMRQGFNVTKLLDNNP